MSHQEPNQEFAPALQPDFTNQDHVFIVLEELGIAYMQNAWPCGRQGREGPERRIPRGRRLAPDGQG